MRRMKNKKVLEPILGKRNQRQRIKLEKKAIIHVSMMIFSNQDDVY